MLSRRSDLKSSTSAALLGNSSASRYSGVLSTGLRYTTCFENRVERVGLFMFACVDSRKCFRSLAKVLYF